MERMSSLTEVQVMMWQILVCLAVLYLIAVLIFDAKRPKKFPPGPDWLPIIGNYIFFYRLHRELRFTHLVWDRLRSSYGPLIGVKLGKDLIVVASGLKAVREVLTREEFDARPDGFFFRFRSFGRRYGLVFVDGNFFDEQKKFCIKHLKSFGLNRSLMEDRIATEASDMVASFEESCKKPIQLPEAAGLSVINGLWSMVAGERFKIGDPRPQKLLNLIHTVFRLQDMSGGILNQMPYVRFIAPELSCFNQLRAIIETLNGFLKELIVEHRKTADGYDPRDLIDAYLYEIEKQKNSPTSDFTEEQLIVLLLDLFLAGAETTASTLSFAVLYLLHFPEWQTKLHDEMDSVLGPSVQPGIQHKPNLKLLQVFLMELQRHANVTPTTVSHRASKDTEIMGYRIPKNTVVLGSLYSLHMDKEHWGDPESFRPERFLNPDGSINQDPWFLPFGAGKRRCIGESLAKTSLFLFFSAILFKFSVSPVPGSPIPSLRGLDGATITPRSFKCILTPRK